MTAQKILLSSEQIQERVSALGRQITQDYAGQELILLGVLNGAFMFLADLARTIDLPVAIDFIRVASYGNATTSSGSIELIKDTDLALKDKNVLLVEDIVDTGTTAAWLLNHFNGQQTRSVKFCSLIDKKERRETGVMADYVGFHIEKGFLVGYGLDYAGQYRNLPAICTLD